MSENKMTPTPWWEDDDNCIASGSHESYITIAEVLTGLEDREAISKAVNNTYGCGVNPEAVPDLLEALKFVRDAPQFKRMDWKLKVTIDAAIAKAKLI
jgi:hypothetical protein